MAQSPIELGKQYRTRDGREVRIYAVDGGNGFHPIHGAILQPNGGWEVVVWNRDGTPTHCHMSPEMNLIEVKPKITRTYWLVHCVDGGLLGYTFPTEDRAKTYAWQRRPNIAGITGPHEITFTEGDGL
jgi:hypothetical protein